MGVWESWCHKLMLQSAEQLRNMSVLKGFQATLYTGPWGRNKKELCFILKLRAHRVVFNSDLSWKSLAVL